MGWNYERSTKRVKDEWNRLKQAGASVTPLTREMDLTNLSPTEAKLVHGVHFYSTIQNFGDLLQDDLLRRDNYKRLHRLLHVLRTEQRRIVQEVFDGDKIQVQGPKFHGLIYKPYDEDADLAWRSVLASAALHLLAAKALPRVFPQYPAIRSVAGLDLGDAVVANIGIRGERELISVGRPANYAAKISDGVAPITVGENLFASLSKKHQSLFTADQDVYRLDSSTAGSLEQLISAEGFSWSSESSVRKLELLAQELPIDDIVIEEARERIDLDRLGPKRAKVCTGATLFVDIDGYTRFVDSLANKVEDLARAVQLLHLFRYELREVTQSDFEAVTVQHQGDRLQALLHLPSDDEELMKDRAAELAISYNSSIEEVLSKYYENDGALHVAIGCDVGKVLVSRLGVRGDLDVTCIGRSVLRAEALQIGSEAEEITITDRVRDAIRDGLISKLFKYDKLNDAFVAKDPTWTSIEDSEHASAYRTASATVYTGTGTIAFRIPAEAADRPLKVTRPWSE